MQFDLKLLARLLKHGRVDEAGYPTGMEGPDPASGSDHLQTNGMGDNPMVDVSLEETTQMPAVDETMAASLEADLRRYGVTDAIIAMEDYFVDQRGVLSIGHATFTPEQQAELVKTIANVDLGSENGEFLMTVLDVISRGLDEAMGFGNLEQKLDEFRADDAPVDARFTHVIDTLGHVTVNDSKTGKSVYLQGSDALELLGAIPDNASEGQLQHILSQYQHVMESRIEEDAVDDFNKAFASDSVSELKDLESDIMNMRTKLQAMLDKARKSGDVTGAFAADTFVGEVDKLEHALKDYLAKTGA